MSGLLVLLVVLTGVIFYLVDGGDSSAGVMMWSFMMLTSQFVNLIVIFVVIVAADSVAGEFSAGTIKLLLLQPASRSKILLSKYLAVFVFALFLVVLLLVTSFICAGIIFGFNDFTMTYDGADALAIVSLKDSSMFTYLMVIYGIQCISLIFVSSVAFLVSAVFRTSGMAISIAIVLQFFGSSIVVFLQKYEWINYYLFTHVNLMQYLIGQPIIEGTTLSFALTVLAVYFVLINALTWFIFNRRDVA